MSLVESVEAVKGWHHTEGLPGLRNLQNLVRLLGYNGRNSFHGEFSNILDFLADNPGVIYAVKAWIDDQAENHIDEWREALNDELPPEWSEQDEEVCQDCGKPTYGELHSCPIDNRE